MTTKYPLHSQYLRLIDAQQAILNNLKNKSTPLIVNDSYVPPINYTRTDLPWTLGSKAHPWRNLYISNKSASALSSTRSEVIDVYATLSNTVKQADLTALETRVASTYATKIYVDAGDTRIASTTQVGGFKVQQPEYVEKYKPATATGTDAIATKTERTGYLKTIDDTETLTPYWNTPSKLLKADRPKETYTGDLFYFVKISEAFPGVYKSEYDNYYTLVYSSVKDTVLFVELIRRRYPKNSVYTTSEYAKVDILWGDIDGDIQEQIDLVNFVNSSVQTATAFFCGNWDTWDSVPTTVAGFTDLGLNAPNINNYLVINEDSSHSHTGSRWRYKYDQKVTTKAPYDKNHWIPEYEVNDKPFTAAERAALSSGITSAKVATYDGYATSKVNKTDYATTSMAGVVKADGTTISVAADGTLSAIGGGDVQVELGGYDWVTSASGRRFTRNEANTGTIMEWNDNGTTRWTVVFDAKYRAVKPLYSDFTTNLGLTTFTNIGNTIPSAPASGSDTVLNANNNFNQDARGNTAATTEWMSKASVASYTNGAMYYARSLTALNPTGVDLPTINCLTRIYNDRVILDSMDPTVSTSPYNHYALTPWTFGSASEIWSASWYGSYSSYYCVVLVTSAGKVSGNNQNIVYGIIPVLDITNPEA